MDVSICAIFLALITGKNFDREKCYAFVVKIIVIEKEVVDSETRNFLTTGFYR